MEGSDRQRPAITTLDVIMLSPVEAYAVLADLAHDPGPEVARALTDAVARVVARNRIGGQP